MSGPDLESSGVAGSNDKGAVGSRGGGQNGFGNTGEALVIGFELLCRCGEELVAVTEERDAGNFGRETTLRFGFFACFRIPEFVETVDSRRGKSGGVRTPRKRENMIVVAFESFFERRGVKLVDLDCSVGGS